jgi:hypothetical protein
MRESIDRYFELLPILVLALAVLIAEEARGAFPRNSPVFTVISGSLPILR